MNLYCDNYSVCNSYLVEGITEDQARVKGWHIFHGLDHGGRAHDARLCPRCMETKRRKLDPAPPPQPGDQVLFEIVAYTDETAS